jgi:CRISPR-associated protein Csb2
VAKAVRDLAAHRLVQALPDRVTEIERVVVGRNASELDKPRRIRVVPLPTIGFEHADPAIRRVLFEVPPDCPIAIADLMWSVSGQSICDRVDRGTGEIAEGPILVPAENDRMLRHYGVEGRPARRWRTVTPAVLAERRPRGRIGGAARVSAEREAAAAVADALRNAGIDAAGVEVRVQAEPFHRKGLRAEAFQPDRFDQRMLRHVEVNFPRAVQGPLVIGNGRWLGLGLMAPTAQDVPALHLFLIDPAQAPVADQAEMLTRALRRATMAQAQQRLGRGEHLPTFFTGHEPDGSRACSGRHEHLFFLADDADGDGRIDRLAIVAPHLADRSIASGDQRALRLLEAAIADMTILRAGRAGAPRLIPAPLPDASDAVFGRARSWLSRTWYRPTRHLHRKRDATEALHSDLLGECARRRLPRPEVEVIDILSGPRGGIAGRFRLRFDVAVEGPLLLGAGSHFGAGLFAAEYDGPST